MSSTLSQVHAARPVTASQMLAAMLLYFDDTAAADGSKDKAAQVTELRKALSGYHASANASGNTTVTPGVLAMSHIEVLTISGSAGTRVVILDTSNTPAAGDRIALRLSLPVTPSILLDIRNATSTGTQVTTFNTDGSGDDAVLDFYFDGTAWQFLKAAYPANA